jgi:flagellar basal-body rod protein FlgB
MIEALFNQTGYLAAKKTLDAVALRQEAIANNIANLETPGYKRFKRNWSTPVPPAIRRKLPG